MVIAGPGAGKTTTAVALIGAVLDRVDADRAVLFISFSNAAIDAALDSMSGLDDDQSERVMAMTLDSLAIQLIDDEPTSAQEPNFNRRLNRATEYLAASDGDDFSDLAHLIVDEAQDMSAERRVLLRSIIDSLPAECGFTIFGDPLQAIYSFDGADGSSRAWDALYQDLIVDGARPPILSLDQEYRARSTQPRRIAESLAALREGSAERSVVEVHLEEALVHAAEIDLDRLVRQLARWTGSTAILTWRNSEVLDLVDALRRQGVQCDRVEPLSTSTPRISAWVADLFSATGGRPFDAADFDEFCGHHSEVQPEWFRTLAYAIEASSPRLEWSSIAQMMQRDHSRDRPWHHGATGISVSTIHQSKGREYDNVVVANPDRILRPIEGEAQLELLYVALTRAHDRVYALHWHTPWSKRVSGTNTYTRTPPGRKRPTAISLTSSDLRNAGGPGGQEALTSARPGDLIQFEPLKSIDRPVFRLVLHGQTVGVTADHFGDVVKRLFRDKFPALGPMPLEGVETIVSTAPDTGFTLRPRLAGYSDLTF